MAADGNGKKQVGSVMVVGAGIAGIQASMDLAESGFKVHLVEQSPSIGGAMTQLDKTFPTNDCSMCIVSPKLVEASRHTNIELHTYSEVQEISGSAGRFSVRIRQKARSVDAEKCTGCGTCVASCPVRQVVRVQERFPLVESEITRRTDQIISTYGTNRESLIMILQEISAVFNYLPEDALRTVSERLQIPFSEVYGTASFYKAFSLEPKGKHIVQVCLGTACHVRGAPLVLEELERVLGIPDGKTTDDGLFTLETVNCLGACALGPIVVVDGEYHGNMSMG
ncbi:MAG: NAD(P)H-dependent oxidoreductase subunit E, partial [Spirochaetales bacterium]|nr:NAD(P)H-dependent oxidoreductase subunit E [Spirochaetales bacterium]